VSQNRLFFFRIFWAKLFQKSQPTCPNVLLDPDPCVQQGCQMVYFQTKYIILGKILEGLRSENVDKFYAHWEYFRDIWNIIWPLVTFCVHLVNYFPFWYYVPRKIWQPVCAASVRNSGSGVGRGCSYRFHKHCQRLLIAQSTNYLSLACPISFCIFYV
jgi:hypothetical protein